MDHSSWGGKELDTTEWVTHWEPLWLSWLRICLQYRRPEFSPWIGRIPWKREALPILVFLPEEFHGQRTLVGYSPWGQKESDTTERLNTFNTYYIAQNISRFYRIELEWINGYYKKVVFLMNKSNYLALPTLILLTGLNYIKWENQLTHYVNVNRLQPKVQQCCNRDISVPV